MELWEYDEYFKALKHIDWDEDCSDVENSWGGPDSICCVNLPERNDTGDAMSESNEPVSFYHNKTDLESAIVEQVSKNNKKTINWG